MTLPYFPFYPDDYLSDTAHLTPTEDGFYLRLLMLCWHGPGCTIPDDDVWLRRKLRVSQAEYDAHVPALIDEFFVHGGGRLFSQRLQKEWQQAHEAHGKRVDAGKRGAMARALKNKEKMSSNARAMLKQPEPEPEPEPDEFCIEDRASRSNVSYKRPTLVKGERNG